MNNLALFTWVPKLVEGYSIEHMNMDESSIKSSDVTRKLTMIQNDKTKTETESMGFESNEYDNMKEFFDNEVKKNDPK